MRVKIAYTDCPSWIRRHVEAALLVAEGLPDARQVVLDYLMSVVPFRHHRLTIVSAEDSMAILVREAREGGQVLASIELIEA